MKKSFFILLCLVTLLSSCIEIVEEVTINSNKSGTFNISMDLGTLGGLALKNMGEKYVPKSTLELLDKLPDTMAEMLKEVNGLSNIKSASNKNGLYMVRFDFENVKQLNQAVYKLFQIKKRFYEPNYIRLTSHKLIKKNYAPLLRIFAKKYEDQLGDKNLLQKVYYKSLIHFPNEATRFTNKNASLSANSKTVEYKCTLQELLTSKVNIGNKIKY